MASAELPVAEQVRPLGLIAYLVAWIVMPQAPFPSPAAAQAPPAPQTPQAV